jgi:hypothetical protein
VPPVCLCQLTGNPFGLGCAVTPSNSSSRRLCSASPALQSSERPRPREPADRVQQAPVVPKNRIRTDSRDEAESEHHPQRCLPSSIFSGRLLPTCSSRGAGLKSRTSFFGISSADEERLTSTSRRPRVRGSTPSRGSSPNLPSG